MSFFICVTSIEPLPARQSGCPSRLPLIQPRCFSSQLSAFPPPADYPPILSPSKPARSIHQKTTPPFQRSHTIDPPFAREEEIKPSTLYAISISGGPTPRKLFLNAQPARTRDSRISEAQSSRERRLEIMNSAKRKLAAMTIFGLAFDCHHKTPRNEIEETCNNEMKRRDGNLPSQFDIDNSALTGLLFARAHRDCPCALGAEGFCGFPGIQLLGRQMSNSSPRSSGRSKLFSDGCGSHKPLTKGPCFASPLSRPSQRCGSVLILGPDARRSWSCVARLCSRPRLIGVKPRDDRGWLVCCWLKEERKRRS